MKNKKLNFIYLSLLSLLMCLGFVKPMSIDAVAVNKIPLTALDAWKVVNWWDASSTYDAKGAKMTIEGNTTGTAWQKGSRINWDGTLNSVFDITEGKIVNFKFSLGLTDAGATSNNGDQFDIVAFTSTGTEIGRIRVFFTVGSGDHPIDLYEGGNWSNYAQDIWLTGDASLSSEFNIAFSKENLFMGYYNGSQELRRLDNPSNGFKNAVGNKLADVKSVYFEVKGDNGFTKNVDIIVTEINGQSLANDGANFTDTQAPRIFANNTLATIPANEEYELPAYAVDLLDSNVSYSLTFGDAAPESYVYESGKKFTLTQAGVYDITLHAVDDAENESTKTFTITATLVIDPPVLQSVPELEDIDTEVGAIIVIDAPTVVESTGTYTLKLNIYAEESLLTTINPSAGDGKFRIRVPFGFTSGDYSFEYVATNTGGTTNSDVQTITISVKAFLETNLVAGAGLSVNDSSTAMADYVDSGLRIRTSQAWSKYKLGNDNIFDMKYGVEVVFTVPKISTSGEQNSLFGGRASFIIYNPTVYDAESNPSGSLNSNGEIVENYMMYGVWAGAGTNDSPTNVYICYNSEMHDITDTGWIKTYDENNRRYRMSFDMDNYFMGERESGMTIAETEGNDKARTHIAALLNIIGSSKLAIAMELGGWAGEDYEIIVNSINGQNFANTNGTITTINNAKLEVGVVPTSVVKGQTTNIVAYGKDMINNAGLKAVITDPDNAVSTVNIFNGLSFTPSKLGTYTIKFEIEGANGTKVESQVYTVTSKSKLSEITVELDGEYDSSYSVSEEVTIIDVVENEAIKDMQIVVKKPDNSEVTVTAGSKFKFDKPGVYTIRYIAKDDAEPTPNEFYKIIQINVIDEVDPVVNIPNAPTTGTVGKEISVPNIVVTDDSDYDVVVKLIKPDGTSTQIQTTTATFKFTPDKEGTYKIEVTATDLYDNSTVKTFEITVTAAPAQNGINPLVIGGIAMVVVIGLAAAFFFFKKKH